MKRLKELMARTVLPEQIFLVSLAVSVATCDITGNRQILLSLLYALWKQRKASLLCFSLNRCLFEAGSLLTFTAYKLASYFYTSLPNRFISVNDTIKL